jgi:hypothetical protein
MSKNINLEKQAAVGMLVEQGVDFDTAVNLVNAKAEEMQKEAGDKLRGVVSPAWMENHIAKEHGKEGPKGALANVKSHLKGSIRASGRGFAEAIGGGAVGAAAGAGVAALTRGKVHPTTGAAVGGYVGYNAGGIHGMTKSLGNQSKEMHEKYREKQAAVDMLIEHGMDFDTAVDLVQAKADELGIK